MKKLEFVVENPKSLNSIKKFLSFASEDIKGFTIISENNISIDLSEDSEPEKVMSKVEKLLKRFNSEVSSLEEIILFTHSSSREYIDKNKIYNSDLIKYFGDGLISLKGNAIKLFRYFDDMFKSFALDVNAEEKSYPVLLPLSGYKKTGYLKTSPQYAIFCCSPKEDIEILQSINRCANEKKLLEVTNQPQHALSPAACFHSYIEFENHNFDKPSTITFIQSVFRHEGRFNWDSFARLKDYHVREIVFFGDSSYVAGMREKIAKKTQKFIESLDLTGRMSITFDPFVIPSMQKFKKIQVQEQSKYEMQLAFSESDYLAVASFNLHGTAFTDSFHISVNNCVEPTVTGCVGFGIERWVLAFLSQYGLDASKWPKIIKEYLKRSTI